MMLKTKLLRDISYNENAKRNLQELDEDEFFDFKHFVNRGGQLQVTKDSNLSISSRSTQAQVLGVFGAIASIDVSAASRLATELSSGHMRWVEAVSKLRKFVYTKEVSEPVLALAARAKTGSQKEAGFSTNLSEDEEPLSDSSRPLYPFLYPSRLQADLETYEFSKIRYFNVKRTSSLRDGVNLGVPQKIARKVETPKS